MTNFPSLFSVMPLGESPTLLYPFAQAPTYHQTRLSGLDPSGASIIVFLLPNKQLSVNQVAKVSIRRIVNGVEQWELHQVITNTKRSVQLQVSGRCTCLLRVELDIDVLPPQLTESIVDDITNCVKTTCTLGRYVDSLDLQP
jgi:hypothetical protein